MQKYVDEVYFLIKELCKIPAPSHYEDERAKFCKNYFESVGFNGAYIDEAKNVILEYNCSGSNEITVFVTKETFNSLKKVEEATQINAYYNIISKEGYYKPIKDNQVKFVNLNF